MRPLVRNSIELYSTDFCNTYYNTLENQDNLEYESYERHLTAFVSDSWKI